MASYETKAVSGSKIDARWELQAERSLLRVVSLQEKWRVERRSLVVCLDSELVGAWEWRSAELAPT